MKIAYCLAALIIFAATVNCCWWATQSKASDFLAINLILLSLIVGCPSAAYCILHAFP